MLLIYGTKNAKLKLFSDHTHQCQNCKELDISGIVTQDYFHIFYIPVWPIGPKNARAWCNKCGQRFAAVSLEKQYEGQTKTPFYFYTIPLILGAFVLFLVIVSISSQNEKAELVKNPKVGDTYLIRKDQNDSTFYYFLRITNISGDTVNVYHNSLMYYRYTTSMLPSDSFVTDDKLIFTKAELERMYDSDEINSIRR